MMSHKTIAKNRSFWKKAKKNYSKVARMGKLVVDFLRNNRQRSYCAAMPSGERNISHKISKHFCRVFSRPEKNKECDKES